MGRLDIKGRGHRPSDGDKAQRIGALDKAKGLPALSPEGTSWDGQRRQGDGGASAVREGH